MENPIKPAVTMGRHHDQVRTDVFGFPHDLLKRCTNSEAASTLGVLGAQMLLDESELAFGVTFLDSEQLNSSHPSLIVKLIRFLEDVQEGEIGIE